MPSDDVVASLVRVPIFAGLTPQQLEKVAERAQACAFARGETIIEYGDQGDAAYLVLDGDASLRTGPNPLAPLAPIEPGSLLGELAMLVDHVYGVTVIAEGPVNCLKIERATLHTQMCEDPDMADRLADVIRERLARVASELQEIDELLAAAAQIEPPAQVALLPPPDASSVTGAAA